MSLFKILDENQIATILDHTIATRVFDESKMMLIYVVSSRCRQAVPFEEIFEYGSCIGVVCIELTPNGISFSGTKEYCTKELTHVVTAILRPYGKRIYHQNLAHDAVKKAIKGDTALLYTLANSLYANVGLTEEDGYYNTIGERAFFTLVAKGELDVNLAYTIGY